MFEADIVIERGERAGVHVTGVSVSREHARLIPVGPRLALVDLGSKNGTTVNGRGVDAVLLEDGDVIRLGAGVMITVRDVRSQQRVVETRIASG